MTHMNKSGSARALYRTMGSLAWTAAARAAWLVAEDKDDKKRRLLLPLKNNLVEAPTGLKFQIVDGVVHWFDETVTIDADSVLVEDRDSAGTRQAASDWLASLLAPGPMPVKEIRAAAVADCHSWRTVNRAKQELGVRAERNGYGSGGQWSWALRTDPS